MPTHIVEATLYPMYNSKYKKTLPSGHRCRFPQPSPFGLPSILKEWHQKYQFLGYHRQTKELYITLLHPHDTVRLKPFKNQFKKSKGPREHPIISYVNWRARVNQRSTTTATEVYIPRDYWEAPEDLMGNIKIDAVLFPTRMLYQPVVVARLVGVMGRMSKFAPKKRKQ